MEHSGLQPDVIKPNDTQFDDIQNARILIVDDEEANVRLLERMLQKMRYNNLRSTLDSREVLAVYVEFQPDLILLDLTMPHYDGFEVMQGLETVVPKGEYLPILVLTADVTSQARRRALAAGARDFITKPFDAMEVLLRIQNLLRTRLLHQQLHGQNQVLEQRVKERTRALEESQAEVLHRLARAAEYRDDDTGQHTHRVGHAAALLGQTLGLPEGDVELLQRAAPLHDVGKIGISDAILLKPGKLLPEEFEIIKTHTTIGAEMLAGGHSPLVQVAETIALTHHERWDGSGYPQGLKGEDVPLMGRIVALADVFDALTCERPYKKAWPVEAAVAEIERQSGQQFDPQIVEAFLHLQSAAAWPLYQQAEAQAEAAANLGRIELSP